MIRALPEGPRQDLKDHSSQIPTEKQARRMTGLYCNSNDT